MSVTGPTEPSLWISAPVLQKTPDACPRTRSHGYPTYTTGRHIPVIWHSMSYDRYMFGICQIYVTGRDMTGIYIYLSCTYILTFLQVPDVENRNDDGNECLDWFGICCWDAFSRVYWYTKYVLSTDFSQTVPKMMKLVCTNSFSSLKMLCIYTVRTMYIICTYNVHTLYVQNMVKVHTVYISVQNYAFFTYTVCTFDFSSWHRSVSQYVQTCTDNCKYDHVRTLFIIGHGQTR